jgi:hypothetical protein
VRTGGADQPSTDTTRTRTYELERQLSFPEGVSTKDSLMHKGQTKWEHEFVGADEHNVNRRPELRGASYR